MLALLRLRPPPSSSSTFTVRSSSSSSLTKPSSTTKFFSPIQHYYTCCNSSTLRRRMSLNLKISTSIPSTTSPILLFDIMDTIVRDPFYHDVPAFFRMTLKELIECKHPTVWIDFEKGLIDEVQLARMFFKDGRPFDLEGLKKCMIKGYSYLEGIEELLCALKRNNYEIHAFTNYPIWYQMIEDKLKLSKYLSWTFCSCIYGKRKPEPEFYLEVLRHLDVDPSNCIFVDDRERNVEAAVNAGIVGIHFKDANLLTQQLSSLLGFDIDVHENNTNPLID